MDVGSVRHEEPSRILTILNNKKGDRITNKKLSVKNKIALIIAGSLALTIITGISQSMRDDSVTGISRPGAGETKEVEINAYNNENEEPYPVTVKVAAKSYTGEETQQILDRTLEELKESIKGDNPDLEHVTGNLDLKTTFADNLVTAEWTSSDFETISYDGTVSNSEFEADEIRYVNLPVRLTMGEEFRDSVVEVIVRAPLLDERESFKKSIEKAIDSSDVAHAGEDVVPLPVDVNGESIRFAQAEKNVSPWVFIPLGIAASVCIWFYERQKKERALRERNEILSGEYSALSSKLSLLCGAGMTVYSAWKAIAGRYEDDRKSGMTKRKESYERMNETLGMIDRGMGEPEAYTRFGELCGIREYKKLGSYLSEYVKKGTGDLKRLLYTEAQDSFVRRRAAVKVRAEEAGTRLLFPMMLMLGVVMAIVLLPSVRSFVM